MDMYDREMEDLETDLANGVISQEEFNKSVRRLQREYREEAMQSALFSSYDLTNLDE